MRGEVLDLSASSDVLPVLLVFDPEPSLVVADLDPDICPGRPRFLVDGVRCGGVNIVSRGGALFSGPTSVFVYFKLL